MRTVSVIQGGNRVAGWGMCILLLPAMWVSVATSSAAPPLDPLPIPIFSLDSESPSVQQGVVSSDDVLLSDDDVPVIGAYGIDFGLGLDGDDVDALSYNNAMSPMGEFVFLFSVDRATTGEVPPDFLLVELEVPYSATDQATRGQAAGDWCMSLELFTRDGRLLRGGPTTTNNTLVVNNYDEGGTHFGVQPESSAKDTYRVPQDNVDATARCPDEMKGCDMQNAYFCVTAESPSLMTLPGYDDPSGSNIYFTPDLPFPEDPDLFAYYWQLGLQSGDDIDAMVVFDFDYNGLFSGMDLVLFSLAPGSPSLPDPGAAADILAATHGQSFELFAPAWVLGLEGAEDNIDALDILPIGPDGTIEAAQRHGIRRKWGDWNEDGAVDLLDYVSFFDCMQGPDVDVPLLCAVFDWDQDGDVDLQDAARFQAAQTYK